MRVPALPLCQCGASLVRRDDTHPVLAYICTPCADGATRCQSCHEDHVATHREAPA